MRKMQKDPLESTVFFGIVLLWFFLLPGADGRGLFR